MTTTATCPNWSKVEIDILPSIIRRGNHFIRLPGEYWNDKPVGWVLIDGPWFDYLTRLGNGNRTVRLPQAWDWSEQPIHHHFTLAGPLGIEIEWEQIRWHPGVFVHPNRLTNSWLAFKWGEVLNYRKKLGWRLYPDGTLPAYLNRIEFIKDAWQSEEMYRKGY